MRGLLLALVALFVATPANAEWWRAETDHFIIYSEDERDATEKFSRDLERFDNALRLLHGQPIRPAKPISAANKVTIFRFGRVRDIAAMAGNASSGVAGFYIPRAGGAVAFTPVRKDRKEGRSFSEREDPRTALDPRSILQHEYVHHFMLHNFPTTYPDWYVEAFAEVNATIVLNDNGSFQVGNVPQYRGDQIYLLPDIPLNDLFDQNHKRDEIDRIQFYGYGWLLAHYLTFERKREGQLLNYLNALGRGEDGLNAARKAFGDLGQLEREVKAYKAKMRRAAPGIVWKPAAYSPPTVQLRPLAQGEASVMGEWMRSRRGVSRKQAVDVARDIEPKAGRHPDSLFVQLAAAEAFLDARRFAEAAAAADRALAIDPNSSQALIFRGMIALERGEDGEKAQFAQARAPLARASQIDPDDPRPLILYYLSFSEAGETAPETALIGLDQAFPHAASDSGYRMILARQLLSEGKGTLAKSVLAPIAFRFHGDQKDNKVRAVVALIDANKVSEAHASIAAMMKEAEEKAKKS